MKKKKLKRAIKLAVYHHYEYIGGYTNTAARVLREIFHEIDKEYSKKHKTKRPVKDIEFSNKI